MKNLDLQTTIDGLYNNPKILSVFIFCLPNLEPYVSILYRDKNLKDSEILVDISDLHYLLDNFSITTIRGYEYVRLSNGKYLHQIIQPACHGCVTHHISKKFTLDNRKSSLQELNREIHLQFHRGQAPRKSKKNS